jgi:hypothetical protein
MMREKGVFYCFKVFFRTLTLEASYLEIEKKLTQGFVSPCHIYDIHISAFHIMTIIIVINNAFHHVELVSLFITLHIHVLRYDVCSILTTAPIRELNLIGSGIQHGYGVGAPLHGTIKLTLSHQNLCSLYIINKVLSLELQQSGHKFQHNQCHQCRKYPASWKKEILHPKKYRTLESKNQRRSLGHT